MNIKSINYAKIASKAIDRVLAPVLVAQEQDLIMDGSGELGSRICGHYEDIFNNMAESIAKRFGLELADIGLYEQQAEDKFFNAVTKHHINK